MLWKDVVGYEGLYEVSDAGDVRSKLRYVSSNNRKENAKNFHIESRILSKAYSGDVGVVCLSKNGVIKTKTVSKLVVDAFGKNPKKLRHVLHKDYDKSNCSLDNLIPSTRSEAEQHYAGGRKINGNFTEKEKEILAIYESTESTKVIASNHGINVSSVYNIKCGRTWSNLTRHNK